MRPRPSVVAALAVALIAALAMCASPLLGVWGVESALVLGVLLPPLVGVAAARSTRAALDAWAPADGAALLTRAGALAVGIWAAPTAVIGLNALRVPSCAQGEGLAFLVAGPGIGCLLAGVVGAACAAWLPRGAALAAAAVPLASYAASVAGILGSPAIFAYDAFAGWFPGTLYDRGTTFPAALASFRAITLAGGGAVAALTLAGLEPGARRAHPAALGRRPGWLLAGAALAATASAGTAAGESLGHRSTVAGIVDALGATVRGARCLVHAPREADAALVAQLARDCDFRVRQAEHRLGLRQPAPIRAFYFRDADEKRRLMGASRTLVAKPWRNEVYLQLAGWPHPVVAHEVAHVVAGQAGRGPFRVATAGPLGIVPDLALVEGTAVAVAFRTRGDLTPHQWSRALLEIDRLPPLASLRGLRFLLRPPRDAYTVTGSFLRWLADTRGRGVLARAYRTGDLAAATGEPLDELEAGWRRFLRSVPLPDGALARARERFGRPTLFTTVCPHRVATLGEELHAARSAGDLPRVVERATDILDIDAGEAVARAVRAEARARLGDAAGARDDVRVLEGATAPVRARAAEGLADAAWARGSVEEARAAYRRLEGEPRDEAALRAIELKALGLRAGGDVGDAIFRLLVERGERPVPPALAVYLARRLAARRDDGLGAYLEARQLGFAMAWGPAAERTADALTRGLPTERLTREARRMLGAARFAAGDLTGAGAAWRVVLRGAAPDTADHVEALDWLWRIRWARARGEAVSSPGPARTAS